MMGQNKSDMGDITVSSLRVINSQGGTIGYFGGAYVDEISTNDAMLSLFNDNETKVIHLGSGDTSNGGVIKTFNKYGTNTTYTGVALNDDGLIVISNKYGDEEWSQ